MRIGLVVRVGRVVMVEIGVKYRIEVIVGIIFFVFLSVVCGFK